MISFRNRVGDNLRRSPLFVAYVILVVLIVIGFLYMEALTRQIEEQSAARAKIQCLAGNDTRQVLASILDALAVPREDDESGDFEDRMELRRQLDPILLPKDCDETLVPQGTELDDAREDATDALRDLMP